MKVLPLVIEGARRLESPVHADDRGFFREWFKYPDLEEAGVAWTVQQANLSRSPRNSVRGLHYSLAPEGQAKIVTCAHGDLVDVLVDVRVGSPTFGVSEAVVMSAGDGVSVYVPSGVAHGWCANSEDGVLVYLLSSRYKPEMESGIHPLDPDLTIDWRLTAPAVLSPKDAEAPSLRVRSEQGGLPEFAPAVRTPLPD